MYHCIFIDYKSVGCYRDAEDRAIPLVEGTDPLLDGHYSSRLNAVAKCAVVARKNGFRMFAVQNGGWCAGSLAAVETFDKYGISYDCQGDGKGGDLANNVYVIQGKWNFINVALYSRLLF